MKSARLTVTLCSCLQCVTSDLFAVVPVDAENNGPRRQLLRDVLLGRNPDMEKWV